MTDARPQFDRRLAAALLHDRHPRVVPAAGGRDVSPEELNGDVLDLQFHVCGLLDRRRERALRRCFATAHSLLVHGDRDVRDAICGHFVVPHLIFQADLAWAQTLMPPLLAELCAKAREFAERDSPGPS